MMLGESATVTFDLSTMKNFHAKKDENKIISRGHYKSIGEDAEFLVFEIDTFRIVRDKKEHYRPNRNGTSGRSFFM